MLFRSLFFSVRTAGASLFLLSKHTEQSIDFNGAEPELLSERSSASVTCACQLNEKDLFALTVLIFALTVFLFALTVFLFALKGFLFALKVLLFGLAVKIAF